MKHVWSIICEKSSIDFETNILSLLNCVEEMKLVIDKTQMSENKKIDIPANLQLVNFWTIENTKKENTLDFKCEFIDPLGNTLNQFEKNFKIKKDSSRFRTRINIKGITATENGRYYFKIWQKKGTKFNLVAELPLDINILYNIK